MIKNGWKIFYKLLSALDFTDDNEMYLYLMLLVANSFAGIIHVILLCIFLVAGIWSMALVNCISMLVYVANYFCLRRKKYRLTGLVITAEVIAYVSVSTLLIGFGYYNVIYLFLMLVMQFIIPYASTQLTAAVIGALWLTLNANMLLGSYYVPATINGPSNFILSLFNINICFIGLTIELTFGNLVRRVINQFNTLRIEILEGQANTDPLTRLFNRRYATTFFKRIEQGQETGPWCVALMDIDDFKHINDTYGHVVGDRVLEALAEVMNDTLRKTDVLFRWGGEEFLLLLRNVDLDTASIIMEKLRNIIMETVIEYEELDICITVTIGLEELDSGNIYQSIDRCDKKLYYGKRNGKNQLVCSKAR